MQYFLSVFGVVTFGSYSKRLDAFDINSLILSFIFCNCLMLTRVVESHEPIPRPVGARQALILLSALSAFDMFLLF